MPLYRAKTISDGVNETMLNSMILSYITFVYFFSFFFYLLMMVMHRENFGRTATFVTLAGFAVHTFAIVLRWVE